MENAKQSNETLIVSLPFWGFYASIHDERMDDALERDAEYFASDENEFYPDAKGMEESALCEILNGLADWKKGQTVYAQKYVEAFDGYVKQETGMELGLTFEKLESPKFYNFATDRIFAHIPVSVVEKLRAAVTLGKLAEVIKERHESRSGFCSFYSTNIEEWAKKPVTEWDHNELSTLLIAWMRQEMSEVADEAINENVHDYDPEMAYDAWQACVDWKEFEKKCKEKKQAKGD